MSVRLGKIRAKAVESLMTSPEFIILKAEFYDKGFNDLKKRLSREHPDWDLTGYKTEDGSIDSSKDRED